MARPRGEHKLLDVGCGLGAPALRIAEPYGCEITAVNIIGETMPTWDRTRAVYGERRNEVVRRYGARIADRISARVQRIPAILAHYATFPVLSVMK